MGEPLKHQINPVYPWSSSNYWNWSGFGLGESSGMTVLLLRANCRIQSFTQMKWVLCSSASHYCRTFLLNAARNMTLRWWRNIRLIRGAAGALMSLFIQMLEAKALRLFGEAVYEKKLCGVILKGDSNFALMIKISISASANQRMVPKTFNVGIL